MEFQTKEAEAQHDIGRNDAPRLVHTDGADRRIPEPVLRDTHTCQKEPERFDRWVEIARRAIDRYWDR